MRPVKHAEADVCYRGPSADIGDLWCQRQIQDGISFIEVVYELDDDERKMVAESGKIRLGIHTEPIPPVSMAVTPPGIYEAVEPHLFKEIPELRERGDNAST